MGCACKVNTHIKNIQRHYGGIPTVKTNISDYIKLFLKKTLLLILCLPLLPLMGLFLLSRGIMTNKPFSINRFIKTFKYVRNK